MLKLVAPGFMVKLTAMAVQPMLTGLQISIRTVGEQSGACHWQLKTPVSTLPESTT